MASVDPKPIDPKLAEQAEAIKKLVEKGERDEQEASKEFDELKKIMLQKGMEWAASAMTGSQAMTLQQERDKLLKTLGSSPYVKGLQQKFLATIFPIGGSIINAAYNLYNATPPLMNETQRNELSGIGNKIASLPHKMISGEFDLKQGHSEFISALKALTAFVTKKENLNIVINIGATLLESMHPIGGFIKNAVGDVLQSGLPKNVEGGLMRGLNVMAKNYDNFENGLKQVVQSKLDEVKHQRPQ